MKVDLKKLEALVEEGWLSTQSHPTLPLRIWNYTHTCQFEKHWTPETMMCRGLITDPEGNIVARPFPKFFNLEEVQDLPATSFDVFEKLDGSLGILYWDGDKPCLATRGSFTSEQAIRGTEIFRKQFTQHVNEHLKHYRACGTTLLFEIIYPQNRIVVDYKGEEGVAFLAAIDNETGLDDFANEHMARIVFGGARHVYGVTAEDQKTFNLPGLKDNNLPNAEGYVIRFANSQRVKVKFAEYVRLHKIVTGVNERRVWEVMSTGGNLDAFLENVPDEFFKYVTNIRDRLLADFDKIHDAGINEFERVANTLSNRKEQAAAVANFEHKDIVFLMLDGKVDRVAGNIWRKLKPASTKPFRIEI